VSVAVSPRRSAAVWSTTTAMLLAVVATGCDNAFPEVVVVNNTEEHVLLRDVSFHGCLWSGVLAYGEATSPQRCPPGSDRVHFKKLDVARYCSQQAAQGSLDGVCACDGGAAAGAEPQDSGSTAQVPLWFNYQTISEHHAGYGDFERIELALPDMEQDFSIPGPYGH